MREEVSAKWVQEFQAIICAETEKKKNQQKFSYS